MGDNEDMDRQSEHERIDRIEAKLDDLLSKLGSRQQAETDERTRLDRPSTVEEQVRAELERAKREEAAAATAESEKSQLQQMQEQLAKLHETPPDVPPPPRRTRVMWGAR
jgi:uncharacterized membrane protein YukC